MSFVNLRILFVPAIIGGLGGCTTTNLVDEIKIPIAKVSSTPWETTDPKHPVEVLVITLDKGEPVAEAQVAFKYSGDVLKCPEDDTSVTDQYGRAILSAAYFNQGIIRLQVGDQSQVVDIKALREGHAFDPFVKNGFSARGFRVTIKPVSQPVTFQWGVIISSDPMAYSPFDDKNFHSQFGGR